MGIMKPALICLAAAAVSAQNITVTANFSQAASPAQSIYPMWAEQDIWLPWPEWSLPSTDPLYVGVKFPGYMSEGSLVLAANGRYAPGVNPSLQPGIDGIPDLYPCTPCDPNHSLFKTIDVLIRKNLKVNLDLGVVPKALVAPFSTPEAGAFGTIINRPADYTQYRAYVKALFTYMKSRYGQSAVESWGFQCLREPDNKDIWDPGLTRQNFMNGNLLEYRKLYDYTLAGMRDAGLNVNLSPGNFLGLQGMAFATGSTTWEKGFIDFLGFPTASTGCLCLSGNRVRTKSANGTPNDTVTLSFSAYTSGQLTDYPGDIAQYVKSLNSLLASVPWHWRVSVGETNNMSGGFNNRSEGTQRGAAWLAGIYKNGFDTNLRRFVSWGFKSAPQITHWDDWNGVNGASAHVIDYYRQMQGESRMALSLSTASMSDSRDQLDAIATAKNGVYHLLCYNFNPDLTASNSESVGFYLNGLVPNVRYQVTMSNINGTVGSYIPAWHNDLVKGGLVVNTVLSNPNPAPYDALMEYMISGNPAALAIWNANLANYQKISESSRVPVQNEFLASSTGSLYLALPIPSNTVVLVEAKPFVSIPASVRVVVK